MPDRSKFLDWVCARAEHDLVQKFKSVAAFSWELDIYEIEEGLIRDELRSLCKKLLHDAESKGGS